MMFLTNNERIESLFDDIFDKMEVREQREELLIKRAEKLATEKSKQEAERRKKERRARIEARLRKKLNEQAAFKALDEVQSYLRRGSYCSFLNPGTPLTKKLSHNQPVFSKRKTTMTESKSPSQGKHEEPQVSLGVIEVDR